MPDVRISELTAGDPLAAADLLNTTQGGNSRKVTGAQVRTGLALAGAPSTGILDGGAITINADNTKVDIAAGTGYVADHTTYPPTITVVTWTAKSAVVLSALATRDSTDLAIDINGDVVQQAIYTAEELRSVIFLGGANHQNRTSVGQVFAIHVPAYAPGLSVRDLARALGDVNIDGNIFTSNGANLKLNKSSGSTFSFGRNAATNRDDPHTLTQASQTQVSFFPIFNDGAGTADFSAQTTDIDPNNRDNGTGTLAAVTSNRWTIQRISMFSNTGLVLIQYGITEYTKKASAVAAIATEPFVSLTGSKSATIRAYLVIQEGATTLADAEIISVDRLGFATSVVGDAINLTTDTETDLSGIIKGASGTLDTAVAGTDYVAPGAVTTSGLTQATARLLGRTTASTGAVEEISVGAGLTLSAGSLTAAGAAVAGSWVEISRATASASATVDFTGLDTTYDLYAVEIYNAKPVTDDNTLALRVSTNGGSSYDTSSIYTNTGFTVTGAGTVGTYRNASTALIASNFSGDYGAGNATDENGLSGTYFISRPAVAHWTQFFGTSVEASSDTGTVSINHFGGIYKSTTAVDAVRLYYTSGNIASGTFVLLGRKK